MKTADFLKVKKQLLEPIERRQHRQITEQTIADLPTLLRQEDETIDVCQPTIGHVMQVIFYLFPNIVRDWLMKYYSIEELIKELSMVESLSAVITSPFTLSGSPLEELYEIAQKLNNIQQPRNGWETLPNETDKTPSDDVVRMILLAKHYKCKPNAIINVDERDQFIAESSDIAARLDTFLEKQHYFEKRLVHLSNEWGFLVGILPC